MFTLDNSGDVRTVNELFLFLIRILYFKFSGLGRIWFSSSVPGRYSVSSLSPRMVCRLQERSLCWSELLETELLIA